MTSGLSQGTVVIEATQTSGSAGPTRAGARQEGVPGELLVTDQKWARDYIAKRGAIEVADVDQVVGHLAEPERVHQVGEQRQ